MLHFFRTIALYPKGLSTIYGLGFRVSRVSRSLSKTQRPGDPETKRPGDSETRRPGDPETLRTHQKITSDLNIRLSQTGRKTKVLKANIIAFKKNNDNFETCSVCEKHPPQVFLLLLLPILIFGSVFLSFPTFGELRELYAKSS